MGTKFMKVIQFVSYWHLRSPQQESFLFIDPVFVYVPLGSQNFILRYIFYSKILVVGDPLLKIQSHHFFCVLFNTNDRRQAALTLQIEWKMSNACPNQTCCVVVILPLAQYEYRSTDLTAYIYIYSFGWLFYAKQIAVNWR